MMRNSIIALGIAALAGGALAGAPQPIDDPPGHAR
jgi:hypothetical protein